MNTTTETTTTTDPATVERRIELAKPRPEEKLERGARLILVDGERWGHTVPRSHGVRGMSYRIRQNGGAIVGRLLSGDRWRDVVVYGVSPKRPWESKGDTRTSEELIVAKVRELIAEGLFHDPATVEAERAKVAARIEAHRIEVEAREAASFRARALEAAGYTGEPNDPESVALVERIVAAMRWAQRQ